MRFLAYGIAALVIFTVFVTVFAGSADKREVRVLPKWLWILLCLFTTPIGGLLYLILGRPAGAPKSNFKTVAPDDDPEFLRKLRERLDGDDDK